MAATLGGMMRAPLMAVLFAFEVTQDVNALLPLIMACVTAYGFTVLTMPRSILTEKIARRGRHIYREYGIDPLERHAVREVMSKKLKTIDGATTVADALASNFGPGQTHRAYPVVQGSRYVGMLDLATLLKHKGPGETKPVMDLFGENIPVMALPDETCRSIATRLAVHHLERIPVVQDADSRELIGLVARSDLINPSLALFDEEHNYESSEISALATLKDAFRRR
jgi:CBS domain-containing protein